MNPELSQNLEPQLNQTLELVLSPRMLQMLKVLNMPYIELVEQIQKEADENVMLEVERKDELFEYIKYINSDRNIKKEADFSELPGLENLKDTSKTLEETLLDQLELENLNKKNHGIGKRIIENIDDRGFIGNYTEIREKMMKDLNVSRPTVDKVLKLIQTFEPDGVGARDLKECLLIQVEEYSFENYELEEVLKKVIESHLEDLANKEFEKISKSLGIPVSGVARIAEFIKGNLNPNPGSAYSQESTHVIPSFSVEKTTSGYKIMNLERTYGPVIKISPEYMKMLSDPKTDEKTVKFLKEKLEAAKTLLENLARRYETIGKALDKIISAQTDFLDKGALFLRPLLQKELANEFGVHPSTISRAIGGKYIQTPKGMFLIKLLCPRSHKGFTPMKLKSLIADAIKGEEGARPLSDEDIKQKLEEEGAEVARRTVAAYREELGFPTSRKRGKK